MKDKMIMLDIYGSDCMFKVVDTVISKGDTMYVCVCLDIENKDSCAVIYPKQIKKIIVPA